MHLNTDKESPLRKVYGITLVVITLLLLLMIAGDLFNLISVSKPPFSYVLNVMIFFFTVDYLWRFWRAQHKWKFVRQNIYDLIAILPFGFIFSFFGLTSFVAVGQITRFALIARLIGMFGKFNRSSNRFLNTNSLYKVINFAVAIIMVDSFVFSIAEHIDFADAVWWALVTTTTVGYGDFFPKSLAGKLAAVVLMFLGIGLIGYLTSTITNYFTARISEDEKDEEADQTQKIVLLERKIDLLIQKIDNLENRESE